MSDAPGHSKPLFARTTPRVEKPSFFRRVTGAPGQPAQQGGAPGRSPGLIEQPKAPAKEAPAPLPIGIGPKNSEAARATAREFASRTGNGRVISLREVYQPPPTVEKWLKQKPEEEADAMNPPGGAPATPATVSAPLDQVAVPSAAPEATIAAPSRVQYTEDMLQRRREIEATILRTPPESTYFENEVICRLVELMRAEHACMWIVPTDESIPRDWGHNSIVAEAAAQAFPIDPFTRSSPTASWTAQYLEPLLYQKAPIAFQASPSAATGAAFHPPLMHLGVTISGHQGYRWVLLLARRAGEFSEADALLLEDICGMLALSFEGRLLAKQSIERGTYLNNLLNSSDIAVMVIEQNSARPVITMVNQRFREIFGLQKVKLAGGSPQEFIEQVRPLLPDADQQLAILDNLLENPDAEHIDEMVVGTAGGQGTRVLHRYSAPARDSVGNIFGRMFFFRDITYDKEMERQIIHSQKMDSIGTLAGGVAHDFNNLLTTILGYVELLKRQAKPEDPNHQRLLQIERSANRAAELTGQLLAFSRRNPTITRLFNMNELIQETNAMLRSTVPATIEMVVIPGENLPLVEADETQIQQVLINLVINAKDALVNRKNGVIIVSTRKGVDEQATGEGEGIEYVVMEVEDNGVGIPKESLHRVFEPFFTTKEVGKGTGLGLAMVFGIVKKHGGFIEVNSAENVGTKFSVFMPATSVMPQEEEEEPPMPTSQRRPVTIMVVDDEPDLREFCAAALSDIAENVLTAGDGLEALDCFQRVNFNVDLVVLDLTMPKMAGPECALIMRSMKPNLKILVSSGYGPDVTADPQLQGHVAGYLPKPYDLNQLMAKVEEVLAADGLHSLRDA